MVIWYKRSDDDAERLITTCHLVQKVKELFPDERLAEIYFQSRFDFGSPTIMTAEKAICPFDNRRVRYFDLFTERGKDPEEWPATELKLLPENAVEEIRELIKKGLDSELQRVLSDFNAKNKVPLQCPNKHLLWYDLKTDEITEREERLLFDDLVDILTRGKFVHSLW